MAGQIDCPAPLPDGDADSGSLQGAREDQEGQGNPKEFLTPGVIGLTVR